jgi:hypothetical protein
LSRTRPKPRVARDLVLAAATVAAAGIGTLSASASVPAYARQAMNHGRSAASPRGAVPADISHGSLQNVATGQCLDDSTLFGLRAIACNGLGWQSWL